MAKHPRRIAVVLVNWNGLEDTRACLRSLEGQAAPCTAVVVDNASAAPEADAIAAEFPEAKVLRNEANLGFAGGCNRGLRWALDDGFTHLMLLNNDATAQDSGMLGRLADELDAAPGTAAVGPKVLWASTGRIWFGGGTVRPWLGTVRHRRWKRPTGSFAGVEPTGYVTGCALMAKAAAWQKVGLLDERYFLYFEETDWALRARGLGLGCKVVGDVACLHKVSASMARAGQVQAYCTARSRALFFRRWSPAFWGLPFLVQLIWLARFTLTAVVRGRPRQAAALLRGFRHGLAGRSGLPS